VDYRKFYDLETHLFSEVGPGFEKRGEISSIDFYFILAWKANRKANHQRNRLALLGGTFDLAVASIATCLKNNARNPKAQMRLLRKDWKFRLPTASAILSVLCPNAFSVYDVRVCAQLLELECGDFRRVQRSTFSDDEWED
jgi:hypothetical protein